MLVLLLIIPGCLVYLKNVGFCSKRKSIASKSEVPEMSLIFDGQ